MPLQVTIPANQPAVVPDQQDQSTIHFPPAIKRIGSITGSLAIGALGGYVFYWITRLVARLGAFSDAEKALITPLPYILSGVISAAIVETAKLVHDAAMAVVGERSLYANATPSDEDTLFDRFRQHSWKVLTKIETIKDDTDVVLSRLVGVRSAKEIRELTETKLDRMVDEFTTDRGGTAPEEKQLEVLKEKAIRDVLYWSSQSRLSCFLEVSRHAFWRQVEETILTSIPQELGLYAVEAIGFTLIGGHMFVGLHALMFVTGLLNKVTQVYQKVDDEVREENKQRKWRSEVNRKADCDILSAMYPEEMAQLDDATPVDHSEEDLDQQLDDDLVKTATADLETYLNPAAIHYSFVQKLPSDQTDIDDDEAEVEIDDVPDDLALCEVDLALCEVEG